jgi:hypothetical protein
MKRIFYTFISLSSLFYQLNAESSFVPSASYTGGTLTPNDKPYYKVETQSNSEVIFPKKQIEVAKHTIKLASQIEREYSELYGWKLDEKLYIVLASSHNQIPNAFSTQWPNNRQVNYMGGSALIDSFSSTSWLDTLLYHETAHTYQTNVKGSSISRGLHSLFGNGSFLLPLPIIVPNVVANSFMLEGNAVLNESWHGNGGRLYSGLYRAETILQADANNIVASDVYNNKLAFPYSDIVYIQGGFYNLYVAEKYGMKNLNSYFKNYSSYWLMPLFTNASMRESVGKDFETTLVEFSNKYKKLAKSFVKVEGKKIASSQFNYGLNSDKESIYFLTNESGVRAPELVLINKKTKQLTKERGSWVAGKVVKVGSEYFTQGSKHTSVTRLHQGLFNRDGYIKKSTKSKVVQGYLSDGRSVYIDLLHSFRESQLYVGSDFYTKVNSSVFIDSEDNLYYFKQKGKVRTLYKNRVALYSFRGFYGIVSDVDSRGSIYFIANSKLGSTLYKYSNSKVTRVSNADNIAGAKLLNDKEVLVSAIDDKEYYYVKSELQSLSQEPYEVKLFFENKSYYAKKRDSKRSKKDIKSYKVDSYNSLLNMHYSATDLSLYSTGESVAGTLNVSFGDPLTQNSFNIFGTRDEDNVTQLGAGYSNSLYRLNYNLSLYSVVDDGGASDVREYGVIANATLPLYRAGYYSASLLATLYQDYQTKEREPLTLSLNLQRVEEFGYSMYENYINSLYISITQERDDKIYGVKYTLGSDLAYEFYLKASAKHSQTTSDIVESSAQVSQRGVKVSSSLSLYDTTAISMPTIGSSYYFKSASYAEVSLKKVFNFSSYWFTFPLSLQRESLYVNYRFYDLKRFDKSYDRVNLSEVTLGALFGVVAFNKLELPVTFEYIYSDDESGLVDENEKFLFYIGLDF